MYLIGPDYLLYVHISYIWTLVFNPTKASIYENYSLIVDNNSIEFLAKWIITYDCFMIIK